jgi:hypothetical protein
VQAAAHLTRRAVMFDLDAAGTITVYLYAGRG